MRRTNSRTTFLRTGQYLMAPTEATQATRLNHPGLDRNLLMEKSQKASQVHRYGRQLRWLYVNESVSTALYHFTTISSQYCVMRAFT